MLSVCCCYWSSILACGRETFGCQLWELAWGVCGTCQPAVGSAAYRQWIAPVWSMSGRVSTEGLYALGPQVFWVYGWIWPWRSWLPMGPLGSCCTVAAGWFPWGSPLLFLGGGGLLCSRVPLDVLCSDLCLVCIESWGHPVSSCVLFFVLLYLVLLNQRL